MIWVYFGLSLVFGINFSVFQAGVIALVLLYSAFISEIFRAALQAIPRGQREAGLALGMHPLRVFGRVILPQATKIAIPNIGSMFIGMVKDTSTFTVIGLLEVVHVTQNLELDDVPALRALYRGGRDLRGRRVRDRLHLPHDREVADDTADGPASRRRHLRSRPSSTARDGCGDG